MCAKHITEFEFPLRLNSRKALGFMEDDQSKARSLSGPDNSGKGLMHGTVRIHPPSISG